MGEEIIHIIIYIIIFLILLFFIFGVYAFINNIGLIDYLKQNHPEIYQKVYGDSFFGCFDPITMWKFRFSNEGDEDENIRRYKNKIIKGDKYALITLFIIILTIIILLLYIHYGGYWYG